MWKLRLLRSVAVLCTAGFHVAQTGDRHGYRESPSVHRRAGSMPDRCLGHSWRQGIRSWSVFWWGTGSQCRTSRSTDVMCSNLPQPVTIRAAAFIHHHLERSRDALCTAGSVQDDDDAAVDNERRRSGKQEFIERQQSVTAEWCAADQVGKAVPHRAGFSWWGAWGPAHLGSLSGRL